MNRFWLLVFAMVFCSFCYANAEARVTAFFDSTQVAMEVSSDINTDTISSNGYLFTYTRDKLFTGGGATVTGRYVRVAWPDGLEAQAITTGPNIGIGAQITIRRVDGGVFDLPAFSAKLLANTYGTGGAIEIMPILNDEDGFNDPLYFDVSGSYGMVFSYNTAPNYLGSTALLKGFDAYKVKLFVDFAFTALTLDSPIILNSDIDGDGVVDMSDMAFLAEQWLQTPGIPSADIAPVGGDNIIDMQDFALLASEWLLTR